jgi:hypothetical protein
MITLYVLIVLISIGGILVTSILISRANYQKNLIIAKLEANTKKLQVNETYWYNSAKGFLMENHPSGWAKVLARPRLFGKNQIVVDVMLTVGKKKIETTVPADSLALIEQLNS